MPTDLQPATWFCFALLLFKVYKDPAQGTAPYQSHEELFNPGAESVIGEAGNGGSSASIFINDYMYKLVLWYNCLIVQ